MRKCRNCNNKLWRGKGIHHCHNWWCDYNCFRRFYEREHDGGNADEETKKSR